MTTPITGTSRQILFPACSSSSHPEATPPTERTVFGRNRLHEELLGRGLIDENGMITQKAIDAWEEIPLGEAEMQRLKSLNESVALGKLNLNQCLSFFYRYNGSELEEPFLIGGGALWVLGVEYYTKVLLALGIECPEIYFPESLIERTTTFSADVDIRIKTSTRLSVQFPQFELDFENMLKGKLRKSDVPQKPCTRINNLKNISINCKLGGFDFVFWNVLNAPYLFGHKAIQIPCKILLGEQSVVYPQSVSIHPLQALLDELLNRLNPYQTLNSQGITRQAMALTQGYTIWDFAVWDRLAGYRFKGAVLGQHIKGLIQSHPHPHPSGALISMANATLLCGGSFERTDMMDLWKDTDEQKIADLGELHPSLPALIKLWKKGSRLSSALLPLAAFLWEIFPINRSVRSTLIFTGNQDECSYRIQFFTKENTTLCLQVTSSLSKAYEKLINYCARVRGQVTLEEFLKLLHPEHADDDYPASVFKERWKSLGIPLRELRRRVVSQLQSTNVSIRMMNLNLLCALHEIDPLPVTERGLQECIPLVNVSHYPLVNQCMGSYYGALYAKFHQTLKDDSSKNSIATWLTVAYQNMNSAKAARLTQIFPAFHPHLSDTDYCDLLSKVMSGLLEGHAAQGLILLKNAFEKFESLQPHHFILFCKLVFPYLNAQFKELFHAHLDTLGAILLRLCHPKMDEVQSTTKREMVLLHLIDILLDHSEPQCRHIGIAIIEKLTLGHPFAKLIGIHLHYLKEKTFPAPTGDSIPIVCTDKIKEIENWLVRRNPQRAVKEARQLIATHHSSTTGEAIEGVLFLLWEHLKSKIDTDVFSFKYSLELVHNEIVIKQYFYFCLEAHLKLMELMETLFEKLQFSTNQDFLIAALKYFYSDVPKRLLVSYTQTIVKIFSRSWAPQAEPLSAECRNLIRKHYLKVLTALSEDENTRTFFLTQLYNAGMGDVFSGETDVFETVERALRQPDTSRSDQLTQLKIAKKIYSETHPKISCGTLLLLGKKCLDFNLLPNALEWIEIATSQPFEFPPQQDFVDILNILNKIETLHLMSSLLTHYLRLGGDFKNISHLLAGEFIRQFPLDTIAIIENVDQHPQCVSILQATIKEFEPSSNTEEAFWTRAIQLMVRLGITDDNTWLKVCTQLGLLKTPRVIRKALLAFKEAVSLDLIPSGPFRVECWTALTQEEIPENDSIVQLLLQSIDFLKSIYNIHEHSTVNLRFYTLLKQLYQQFKCRDDVGRAQQLHNAHLSICQSHSDLLTEANIWGLEHTLMLSISGGVTPEMFAMIGSRVEERLKTTIRVSSGNIEMVKTMLCIFNLCFKNPEDQHLLNEFIDAIVPLYGSEVWVLNTLICSLSTPPPSSAKHRERAIDDVLVKFKDAYTVAFVKFPSVYKDIFRDIYSQEGTEYVDCYYNYRWTYDFFLRDHIREITGDSWKELFHQFLELLFHFPITLVNEPQCNTDDVLDHFEGVFDVLFPISSQLPNETIVFLWKKAINSLAEVCSSIELKAAFDYAKFFEILCMNPYPTQDGNSGFYSNVEVLLHVLRNECKQLTPLKILDVVAIVLHQCLTHETQHGFRGIHTLASIVETAIYGVNPILVPEMTELPRSLHSLFNQFDSCASKNPAHPFFQDPRYNFLRGVNSPFEYGMRLAREDSAVHLRIVLQLFNCNMQILESMRVNDSAKLISTFLTILRDGNSISADDITFIRFFDSTIGRFLEMFQRLLGDDYSGESIEITQKYISVRYKFLKQDLESSRRIGTDMCITNCIAYIDNLQRPFLLNVYRHDAMIYWRACIEASACLTRAIEGRQYNHVLFIKFILSLFNPPAKPFFRVFKSGNYDFLAHQLTFLEKSIIELTKQGPEVITKALQDITQSFEHTHHDHSFYQAVIKRLKYPESSSRWFLP